MLFLKRHKKFSSHTLGVFDQNAGVVAVDVIYWIYVEAASHHGEPRQTAAQLLQNDLQS